MSSVTGGEVFVRTAAWGLFGGAIGGFAVGMSRAAEASNNATTDAALQACNGDPMVQEAVRSALEGQVGGAPVGGDVCSVIDGSGYPMSNLAQNTAEHAATANGGPYAAVFNGIESTFLHTEMRLMATAGALALLGGAVAWVGGRLTARRTGNKHLYL